MAEAITPETASGSSDTLIGEALEIGIEAINKILSNQYFTGGPPIYIQTSILFQDLTDWQQRNKVIELIIKEFSSKGWKVQLNDDQRDGYYLSFKA